MQLFNYTSDNTTIRLDISRRVESVVAQGINRNTAKANLVTNNVEFEYLGTSFDNSYLVLSAVSSLITIFLRSQFGQNSKQATIQEYHGEDLLKFKAQKISFQDGRYPVLKLYAPYGKDDVALSIPYVHQFNGALNKAMAWVAPEPDWIT